jgi:hypothetical protein
MASSPETEIMLWLFATPTLLLLWAVSRTYCRMRRGEESARLRKLEPSELAAGAAVLAAAFGFYC